MNILERKVENDVNVICLSGRLDAYASDGVEAKISSLIDAAEVRLVVNFDKLEYISSSGLRVLLAALKRVRKQQGDIRLACLRPSVKEVFDMAGFTQLFTIHDVEEAAIRSFVDNK